MAFKKAKFDDKLEVEALPPLPPVETYDPVEAYDDDAPEGAEPAPVGPSLAPEPPEWEPSKDQQAAYDGLMEWFHGTRSPQVLTTITAEALFIAYKYLQHECPGVPQCFTKFLQSVRPPTLNNNGLWDPLAIIARRRK